MIKVVKAKYLSACDSCHSDCTYLVRADKIYPKHKQLYMPCFPKYIHLCTQCFLKLKQACVEIINGEVNEGKKQVEQ